MAELEMCITCGETFEPGQTGRKADPMGMECAACYRRPVRAEAPQPDKYEGEPADSPMRGGVFLAQPDSQPAEECCLEQKGTHADFCPVAPQPSAPPDPLEEALRREEGWVSYGIGPGSRQVVNPFIAVIRVLKRDHEPSEGTSFNCCGCGRALPCGVLAEAAQALRGEYP